jgi:hypothetical protein
VPLKVARKWPNLKSMKAWAHFFMTHDTGLLPPYSPPKGKPLLPPRARPEKDARKAR